MFRRHQGLSQNDLLAGFFAPLFSRGEIHQTEMIPIPVESSDRAYDHPRRLASRRRKSRVEVQISGV